MAPRVKPDPNFQWFAPAAWYQSIQESMMGQPGPVNPAALPVPTGYFPVGQKGGGVSGVAPIPQSGGGRAGTPLPPVRPFPGYGYPLNAVDQSEVAFNPKNFETYPKQLSDALAKGPLSLDSSVPAGNLSAVNQAQAGEMNSKAGMNALDAIKSAQREAAKFGFGSFDKEGNYTKAPTRDGQELQDIKAAGFRREDGRKYQVERDVSGNIIGMQAMRRISPEGRQEDITDEELARKSWKPQGEAGNPFTPNLSKFMARQDAASIEQAAKNDAVYRQNKMADAVAQVKWNQEQRNSALAAKGLKTNADGSVEAIPGQRPSDTNFQQQTTNIDTTAAAEAAKQQGRQQFESNIGDAEKSAATAKELRNLQDRQTYPTLYGAKTSSGMGTTAALLAAREATTAEKAAQTSTQAGIKALEAGDKKSAELASVPKTTITQTNTPYGQAYTTPTGGAIGKKAMEYYKSTTGASATNPPSAPAAVKPEKKKPQDKK